MTPHKIEWNGEILSIRDICKKEGINERAVYSRIRRLHEDAKTALLYYLNQPNKGNREKIEINGITADLKTHCKNLGVSYGSVVVRIRKTGETAKESLLYFLNQPNKGNREKIELDGELLDIRNYCKQLNYDYKLVTRYKDSQPNKTYTEILKEWETLPQDEILNNIHLYDIWIGMLGRCENPKHRGYKWYGGKKPKPVTVCKEWHDYLKFRQDNWKEYIKHIEKYGRKQTSIDRIDWNGNYEPANCEWADWEQQGKNTSRTKYILSTGETLSHCCIINNYIYDTIVKYIKKYNLTPDEALMRYLKKDNEVKYFLPCNKLLRHHCITNNYSYDTVTYYIRQYNLQPHQALARYLKNKQKSS